MNYSYKIHHRFLSVTAPQMNHAVFRDEEDQGYYLQSIVPFTAYESIAVFRRDIMVVSATDNAIN